MNCRSEAWKRTGKGKFGRDRNGDATAFSAKKAFCIQEIQAILDYIEDRARFVELQWLARMSADLKR